MNFVFISPHFPDNYWRFCQGLKNNNVNVLGIDDVPWEQLQPEVRNSLTDYIYVSNLKNYEEKKRAVQTFISRYGNIDYVESNNEFWMNDDAKLRTEFNIKTGPDNEQIKSFRHKSIMKKYYKEAGIKVVDWCMADSLNQCQNFISKYGYPVIVKPDDGVGSADTHKISNEADLYRFFFHKNDHTQYIMEQFIDGELISFDGVCDSKGDVVFPTYHIFPLPEIRNDVTYEDVIYYTSKTIPADLLDAGQRILKAFHAFSRFYHLEFFRLKKDQPHIGHKGELVGLEVNMRVPGGYTPDMIDFAYSVNIYNIWADVIVYDENREVINLPRYYCAYTGRRFNKVYTNSWNAVLNRYEKQICYCNNNPIVLADGLGDYFFMAKFDDLDQVKSFFQFTLSTPNSSQIKS